MIKKLLSVGIDIGTSTTQVIFSELTVTNTASSYSVPRISITDKQIIYKGNIYFTPLLSPNVIDYDGIKDILTKEYANAHIDKNHIDTGAIIITGESARKDNAKEITQKLSGFAGDFVVATAGPDLESVISGKGAGTDKISKSNNTVAANVDIGGGTSNISVFKRGNCIDTGCLDIGGRLIKIDDNKRITYIAPKIEEIIKKENLDIKLGNEITIEKLKPIINIMVSTLESAFLTDSNGKYLDFIKTNKTIAKNDEIKYITFSGGVAEYIYYEGRIDDWFKYGDIGIILGQSIKHSKFFEKFIIEKPSETIRATVVGAGNHTTDLSGSTISYDYSLLPIKNVPVIKIEEKDFEENLTLISEKKKWFTEGQSGNIALAFEGKVNPSFNEINRLASNILQWYEKNLSKDIPLIIVIENDLAKVLGQTLKMMSQNQYKIICIDNIHLNEGDYIDIGVPVEENSVVPVVVKTLIFN